MQVVSIICGNTSPSIEPIVLMHYTQKTKSGSSYKRINILEKLLESKGANTVWKEYDNILNVYQEEHSAVQIKEVCTTRILSVFNRM